MLANVNGPTASQLAGQLEQIAHGDAVRLAAERTAIELPREKLERLVGSYELGADSDDAHHGRLQPGFDLVITLENGQLVSQATGQAKAPLFAEAESKFFLKVANAQIEFVSAGGRVTELVLPEKTAPAARAISCRRALASVSFF